MNMKRFIAKNSTHALQLIRQTLGEDAVILSNRQLADGTYEVIATADESLQAITPVVSVPKGASRIATARASTTDNWHQVDEENNQITISARGREMLPSSGKGKTRRTSLRQMPAQAEPPPTMTRRPTASALKATLQEAVVVPQAKRLLPETIGSVTDVGMEGEHDPRMLQMQSEISALRGLLENQLAGFAWQKLEQQTPWQAVVFKQLLQAGFQEKLSHEIARHVHTGTDADAAWAQGRAILRECVMTPANDCMKRGGVFAFVGETGAGKTTTIAKIAMRFVQQHGPHSIALLTTDGYRIGAQEQLNSYARLLGISVKLVTDVPTMRAALRTFKQKKLILIDTAGLSQKDPRLTAQMKMLKGTGLPIKNILVMPATSQYRVLAGEMKTYTDLSLAGAVITKVDEAVSLGAPLSLLIQYDIPMLYVCDGQRVPEDIHAGNQDAILDRAFALSLQTPLSEQTIASAYAREQSISGGATTRNTLYAE